MITRLVFYLILISCPLLGDQAASAGLTLDQAKEILRTTQPNRYFIGAASVIKSPENLQHQKTFDDQWAAILRLAADPKLLGADDVKLLVPYLGYGITGDAFYDSRGNRSLVQLKKTFPVFATILANPEAKTVLAAYCLDVTNQGKDRINAFVVLRYVNPDEFKRITPMVNESFSDSSEYVKQYLKGIENNQFFFQGLTPLG